MSNFVRTAALAALAAFAVTAQATVSGSASLTNLHIQLVDLAPADGVDPYLRPYDDYSAALPPVVVSAYTNSGGQKYEAPLGSALTASGIAGPASASAYTTSGNPLGSGVLPSAFASATAPSESNAQAEANLYRLGWTWLSPHSSLIMSGDASVNASWDAPNAESFNVVSGLFVSTIWGIYKSDWSTISGAHGTISSSLKNHVFLNYANNSDSELAVYVSANAYVSVDATTPPPVPEPATFTLSLAGLGLLAGISKWKRRAR
jgi:hypothetical protein